MTENAGGAFRLKNPEHNNVFTSEKASKPTLTKPTTTGAEAPAHSKHGAHSKHEEPSHSPAPATADEEAATKQSEARIAELEAELETLKHRHEAVASPDDNGATHDSSRQKPQYKHYIGCMPSDPDVETKCGERFNILQKLSKSAQCVPEGSFRAGQSVTTWKEMPVGWFGCLPGENKVFTEFHCSGRFRCENGKEVLCGTSRDAERHVCPCPE